MADGDNPAGTRGKRANDAFAAFAARAGQAGRLAAICVVGLSAAACTTMEEAGTEPAVEAAEINDETKFSVAEYGVAASERVTTDRAVPKGGGRQMVGKPYQIAGRWYTPAEDPDYNRTGLASWYGPNFHGRKTANGEIFDQYHLSAAHPTFPLPSYARVTNEANGNSVLVRVNDRGPFAHNRIIDVSSKTAELLGFKQAGTATVNVQYVGPAEMDGHDMPFLMASYREPGQSGPSVAPEGQVASGVMLAMNQASPSGVPGVMTDALAAQPGVASAPVSADQRGAPAGAAVTDPSITASTRPAEAAPAGQPVAAAAPVIEPAPGVTVPAAGDVVTVLPEIGPVLPERPSLETAKTDRVDASAYAESRVAAASDAFESVMTERAALSEDGILGAWKRRGLIRTR